MVSVELVKKIINSILSYHGAKYVTFDFRKIYLNTPIEHDEYSKVKLLDIPQEFFDEYHLHKILHDGWIYSEFHKGVYVLPHARKLFKNLITKQLNAAVYYQSLTTPGLWRHKWRPITVCLIIDGFDIEYVAE